MKEGVRPIEIPQRLREQFGESTFSQPRMFFWHTIFSEGRERVENEKMIAVPLRVWRKRTFVQFVNFWRPTDDLRLQNLPLNLKAVLTISFHVEIGEKSEDLDGNGIKLTRASWKMLLHGDYPPEKESFATAAGMERHGIPSLPQCWAVKVPRININ